MSIGLMRTRVALDTVGCKLNQAETELLARQLAEEGYLLVDTVDEADIYILNTCTVTHTADSKSRHMLRAVHKRNPGARLIVTGCYAERSPQILTQIDGVDRVVSNEEKSHLVRRLGELGYRSGRATLREGGCGKYVGLRTRSFVKIQDGCYSRCAYCIVPVVRGREESVPAEQIISEVQRRIAGGYKEVVLTGTKIGSYDYRGTGLGGLIECILAETGVTRLRMSSLQPREIGPELIGLWKDERLCRHFHLSIQSGNDSVLRRMRRQYTTSKYGEAVSLIRTMVPGAAITTDIIVGFPGESEEEFLGSYNFCRQMEFARIHVFPYSPRQGTEAARLPNRVDGKVKRERTRAMLTLAEESAGRFRRRFLGTTMTVLWEKCTEGTWSGLTDNYIKVYTNSDGDLANQLLSVRMMKVRKDGLWGE